MNPASPTPESELRQLARALKELEANHSQGPGAMGYEDSFKALESRLAESRGEAQVASERWDLRRHSRALAYLASAAALICIGWFSTSRYLAASPLSFRTAGMKLSEGSYLRLEPGQSGRLAFSEGTVVDLQPATRSRLLKVDARGAALLLEDGTVRLHVSRLEEAEWRVHAGPFEVQVTGTVFSVEWTAEEERLVVEVEEGSVEVAGPVVSEGVRVTAGQRYEARLGVGGRREQTLTPRGRPHSDPSPAPNEPTSPPGPSSTQANTGKDDPLIQEASDQRSAPSDARLPARKSFHQRVAEGEAERVISEAESLGLTHVLTTFSLPDLVALGDAARYARRSDLAVLVYEKVRLRFPRTKEAAESAFFWARLVEAAAPAQARRLYESGLSEDPSGRLTTETMGRLMKLQVRLADKAAARHMAQMYLKRAPEGTLAQEARRLLAE